ncbi:MAG: DUF4912 domain-containing protein [Termitinemataceae bacterium]|nr:MAG: DUF4912 domain-containing protein [Termitinemataceae bacterium]
MMWDFDSNHNYLQRFSTPELIALAERFGFDVEPDMDRLFIIEELLEYAPCLNIYQEEQLTVTTHDFDASMMAGEGPCDLECPLPADLPKQYNVTYIDTLIRDPVWIFVFWEIRHVDKKQIEKQEYFENFFIRVRLHQCKLDREFRNLFTVSIDTSDTSRYLHFPPDGPCRTICQQKSDSAFQVELCAQFGKGTGSPPDVQVLATSPSFRLPKTLEIPGENEDLLKHNKLIRLSGLDELPVLRNTDRQSRLPLHYRTT